MQIPETLSRKMRNMALLCAFLVVVIHCRPRFETGSFAWWVKQFTEEGITRVAVPYFFTASGFVAAVKFDCGGYGSLVLKRVRTLLLPFAIWTTLFWLFIFACSCIVQRGINWELLSEMKDPIAFAKQLGFWPMGFPALTPLWYVRALFFLTLTFSLLSGCVRKFGMVWIAALFALYAARLVPADVAGWGTLREFAGFGLWPVEGLVYYSLGIWLCDHQRYLEKGNVLVCVASLLVGLALAGIKVPFLTTGLAVVGGALRFLMVPFLLVGVWGLVPDWRLPSWIVTCSFAIYLIYKFILHLLSHVWSTGGGLAKYFSMALVAFAVSLAIAAAMHRFMPRISAILFGGR